MIDDNKPLIQIGDDEVNTPLPVFWDRLNQHDWWYAMSDDHGVWSRGDRDLREIIDIMNASGPEYRTLFNEFRAYATHTDGDTRAPKPERPSS